MIEKIIACMALALVISGCGVGNGVVKDDIFGAPQVAGVRQDLGGMNDQRLKALVKISIREQKVFLYASNLTNAPIVAKGDIPLALQFKTASVVNGFAEAAKFNASMLDYIRAELRRGRCPEHRFVSLRELPVVYQQKPSRINRKKAARSELILVERNPGTDAPAQGFICPMDQRTFVPYGITKKTKPQLEESPLQPQEAPAAPGVSQ